MISRDFLSLSLKYTLRLCIVWSTVEKIKEGQKASSAKPELRTMQPVQKRPGASFDYFQVLWHYTNIFDDNCPELIGCTNKWPSLAKHTDRTRVS